MATRLIALKLFLLLFNILHTHASISKKFVSNVASKSLLCNSCGLIADTLNETLFEDSNVFEANVGFRLDSSGKKIRKNSQWLRIHITLEEITCEWRKDLFQVAKRKSGLYYLISNDDIKKSDKRNTLNKNKATKSNQNSYFEIGPKVIKKSSKYSKMIDDMCLIITEQFDDWLHMKQSKLKNIQQNELRESLNMTHFCLKDLKYKNKPICKEDMFNMKIDLYSTKKQLVTENEYTFDKWSIANIKRIMKKLYNQIRIPTSTKWFLLDIIFCYMIILVVLALFNVFEAPVIICKMSIIPLLVCPNYLYKRNPAFANFSTYWFIWYWYAIKLYEIFSNEQYFRNKSYIFCWFHCGMMKNMFNASIIHSTFNLDALIMILFHMLFMIQIYPYIFNELLSDEIIMNDICLMAIYPNVLLKLIEILSYTISLLYCMDYSGVFFLNLLGYDIQFDMLSPWKSYSLREFWSKRWNQFVAYELKTYVYKPIIKNTNNKYLSLMVVFVVLGIGHVFPMWLDEVGVNMLTVVFMTFSLQPLLLFIEDKIIGMMLGINNQIIHSLVTFAMLFGSFFVSLTGTCYAIKHY